MNARPAWIMPVVITLSSGAFAQQTTHFAVRFFDCRGSVEQRVTNARTDVSTFRRAPLGEMQGQANTKERVFQVATRPGPAYQFAVSSSRGVAVLRPSQNVAVLTAAIVFQNDVLHYTLTMPLGSTNAALLTATNATGTTLVTARCRWAVKPIR
ncbi:hypothetical protein DES52_10964 [Deinococcus yavapaiensis KR-236]|uniref:Uncharacterized protein n=1 Tax=Deinococcus yavapaiensis KR-236 TaxID=694435 RepID=A0A318SL62_9DEIO|nr:hypothetical protein DES52_10964 [Deinococcus yavapaiensis KR-236]